MEFWRIFLQNVFLLIKDRLRLPLWSTLNRRYSWIGDGSSSSTTAKYVHRKHKTEMPKEIVQMERIQARNYIEVDIRNYNF